MQLQHTEANRPPTGGQLFRPGSPGFCLDTGTTAGQRFLDWCRETGLSGQQLWPVLAWQYHEYLLACDEPAVSAAILQRQLGVLCKRGMRRLRKPERPMIRRLSSMLLAQRWAVPSCGAGDDPKITYYEIA